MTKLPDPTDDLYRIMDNAGLRAPQILASREPMSKHIQKLRDDLSRQLRAYIAIREQAIREEKYGKKV